MQQFDNPPIADTRFFLTLRLALAFACGAAMPFAYAPYDLKWLALLALTGWTLLLLFGRPWVTGFVFGLGWFGLGAWWLAPTLHTFGPLPWVWAVLAVACVGAALAVFPGLLAWATHRLASGNRGRILLLLPLMAVGEEWLRGHLFTGLPWTPLGSLLLDTPAISWAAIVGVYGAALLPVGLAAALTAMLAGVGSRFGLAAFSLLLLAAYFAPPIYQPEGPEHRVALVQGNIPQQLKWDADFLNETMGRYASLSAEAVQRADIIIWPEAAAPLLFEYAPEWRQWLFERMEGWGRTVLFGGLKLDEASGKGQADRSIHNGLYLFEPGQDEWQFVGKKHLVPFGEYVPEWIPFLHKLVPGIGDFRPTHDNGVLFFEGATTEAWKSSFGALICYESIFPEQARQRAQTATVLVNVTNDAWYGQTPATWQHMQAARMRAVETGRYLLRAANTGVSAIIAPDGYVANSMAWFTQGVVYGTYRDALRATPYMRYGDFPLLYLLIPLLIIVLYPRRLAP